MDQSTLPPRLRMMPLFDGRSALVCDRLGLDCTETAREVMAARLRLAVPGVDVLVFVGTVELPADADELDRHWAGVPVDGDPAVVADDELVGDLAEYAYRYGTLRARLWRALGYESDTIPTALDEHIVEQVRQLAAAIPAPPADGSMDPAVSYRRRWFGRAA